MAEDVFVRSLARFLVVFMALRVLAPPGVCLGELSAPLVRFLAEVLHSNRAPIQCDEEGDHTGYCICRLPAGVRPEPTARPCRPSPSPEVADRFCRRAGVRPGAFRRRRHVRPPAASAPPPLKPPPPYLIV